MKTNKKTRRANSGASLRKSGEQKLQRRSLPYIDFDRAREVWLTPAEAAWFDRQMKKKQRLAL